MPIRSIKIFRTLSLGGVCLLIATQASAQLPMPQLNSIFPPGARQAATAECTITGSEINEATGLYFSHRGIQAVALGKDKFRVQVAADVPVGRYDVRAICPGGISSCRSFVVGDRTEFVEKEPNNAPAEAQRVTLPAVVNGQISGGIDLDHFVFAAKKGQRIFIDCWAWRIDSQLDGTFMVYDAQGKELAYAGDYYGKDPFLDFTAPADGDYTVKIWDFVYGGGPINFYRLEIGSLPHLDAALPAAVKPGVSSTLTLFGRNLPGGKPVAGVSIGGQPIEMITREITVAAADGKAESLHAGEAIRPPQSSVDGMDYRLPTPDGLSNPLFLGFTSDPILLEQEPNDTLAQAQRVSLPCEVSGTFTPSGDKDFFAFSAKKGEKLVVEVFGERHSGLVDPVLAGFDAAGKRIITGDDVGRNIGQIRFTTTTRDARWDFNVPKDGEYFVQVRDLYSQQRGEPRFTYRLSLRPERPDFRLLAVPVAEVQPDATVVGQGGNHWIDVLAFRNDGFNEPIRIEAANLPAGVTCEPVIMGPDKTSVPLVFHADAKAPMEHAEIRITGTATIADKPVTRIARGGGLIWSTVNTPGIARLADSIVLGVRQPPPFSLAAATDKKAIVAGGKLPIRVQISRAADWSDNVQLSGFDLPNLASMALVTVSKSAKDGSVELVVPDKVKPGTYSFTIQGSGQVPRNYGTQRDPSKPRGNNIRVVATSNPITITIEPAAKK